MSRGILFFCQKHLSFVGMHKNKPPQCGGFSACQKSLAEFAPAGAKKFKIMFGGGVYGAEHTLQPQVHNLCAKGAQIMRAAGCSLFKRKPSEAGFV